MNIIKIGFLISLIIFLSSCEKKELPKETKMTDAQKAITEKLNEYSPIDLKVDLSNLPEREKKLIQKLVEAGKIVDQIFWKQASHDAIDTRDSLIKADTDESRAFLSYVMINYGPYDNLRDKARFVGSGVPRRPMGGGYYPEDMTKEEFDSFIVANPDKAAMFKNDYTIITRENGVLTATPYSKFYKESEELAAKLEEAAQYADNISLKNYLNLRAKAIRTDNYFESDLAWMDIKDSRIDVVIGPIENYQDEIFNYKTAHEAVIMIKDPEATKELEMYKQNLDNFEKNLPIDDIYKNRTIGDGNIIQVCNVIYFGGDCNQAVKTIAAALPNDPKVADAKGRKLSMYKNHMEAKYEKIVKPIGELMFSAERSKYLNTKAFTSFVTLHEVSHALGPKITIRGKSEEIRHALKDRYSAIEECKADIVSMYNHKYLLETKQYTDEYIKQAITTYVAGLYRSIRFGGGAHFKANLIQLNFLKEKGAIFKTKDGKFDIDDTKFFDAVKELSSLILMTQVRGDYAKAGEILDKYGIITPEIEAEINTLKVIPRDILPNYIY
jgi:hypothetical protein